jgi:hypothetical protein
MTRMDNVRRLFQFRLGELLGVVFAVAMLLGAYRVNWTVFLLVAWLEYGASLVYITRLLKWSDIAMSVCFLLIILPLIIAPLLSTVRT